MRRCSFAATARFDSDELPQVWATDRMMDSSLVIRQVLEEKVINVSNLTIPSTSPLPQEFEPENCDGIPEYDCDGPINGCCFSDNCFALLSGLPALTYTGDLGPIEDQYYLDIIAFYDSVRNGTRQLQYTGVQNSGFGSDFFQWEESAQISNPYDDGIDTYVISVTYGASGWRMRFDGGIGLNTIIDFDTTGGSNCNGQSFVTSTIDEGIGFYITHTPAIVTAEIKENYCCLDNGVCIEADTENCCPETPVDGCCYSDESYAQFTGPLPVNYTPQGVDPFFDQFMSDVADVYNQWVAGGMASRLWSHPLKVEHQFGSDAADIVEVVVWGVADTKAQFRNALRDRLVPADLKPLTKDECHAEIRADRRSCCVRRNVRNGATATRATGRPDSPQDVLPH